MSAVLGVLAACFSIIVVWPQVWLSCRHRRTNGLSATACWLGTALNACWLLYGLLLHDTVQIATNAVVGAANTAILAALLLTQPGLRTRRALAQTAWSATGLMLTAAACGLLVLSFGVSPVAVAAVFGAGISLAGVVQSLPQPISLLRNRTQDLSGLSPAKWWLTVASCACWVGYGLSLGQVAVWGSAAAGLTCALIVCSILVSGRSRAAGMGEARAAAGAAVNGDVPNRRAEVALAA